MSIVEAITHFDPASCNNVKGVIIFKGEKGTTGSDVKIRLSGFPPNSVHAIHIHEFGNLTGGCKTTGSHYNPENTEHGSYLIPSAERHAGDLVNNIYSNESGNVTLDFFDSLVSVSDIFGRAVVIHSLEDDLGTMGEVVEIDSDKNVTVFPYNQMEYCYLKRLCLERGYYKNHNMPKTRNALVRKLETESKKTGNAGGRMCCSVIGRNSE